MDKLKSKNIKMHCILGNHDVYYRNTNEINSIRELFSNDLTLYEKPEVVNFDGLDIALLPWVNKTNKDQCVEFIKTASAPILIRTLRVEWLSSHERCRLFKGMDKDPFDRYEIGVEWSLSLQIRKRKKRILHGYTNIK